METLTAPDFSRGYPSKGVILGPAWTYMWGRLVELARAGEEFVDGRELSEAAAQHVTDQLGFHGPPGPVSAETCAHILRRAHRAMVPLVDLEYRQVDGKRGPRKRAFYRLSGYSRDNYLQPYERA